MKKKLLVCIFFSLVGYFAVGQCPKPHQITTNSKTTNSITLTWRLENNNSLGGDFEIEYGYKNFSLGTGTKISSIVSAVRISNLESNTQYDFYITNKCGDTPTRSDVYQEITTADYCDGDLFMDPGFEKNYTGEYHESWHLKPNTIDQRVVLDFDVFELSPDATLKIWEGNFPIDDPIAVYSNTSPPTEPITSKATEGDFYVMFESTNPQNNALGWVGNITCIEKPQCGMPQYIRTLDITYNSITLRWGKGTRNRTFIEYGPKDFIVGKGEKAETFSNEITISALNDLTEYDFYLTEECDDLSLSDTNKISFSTKEYCLPNISFGWLEAYELNQIKIHNVRFQDGEEWQVEYGLKGFTLGEGITKNYSTSDTVIISDLESDTEYDFYLRNKCGERFGSSIGPFSKKTNIDYCIQGQVYDKGGKDGVYVRHHATGDRYAYIRDNHRARIKVKYVSLDSSERLKIYDGPDSNSPLIKEFSGSYSNNNGEFISSGNSNVIFFDIVGGGLYSDTKWNIFITCEPTPNCEEVSDFKVNKYGLTHNECELNWTKTSNLNDSYKIEYGLEGFERGTGTIVETNNNFITLTNLTKTTSYQAYITTICAEGGQDNVYVQPVTFKTTLDYFGGDKFTDDGGLDNDIPTNQTKITTIYPKVEGERIRIHFDYIDLMKTYKSSTLKIYNGTSTDSEPIATLVNTSNFIDNYGSSIFSEDPKGALTIEFNGASSSFYYNYYSKGWEADIISEKFPDCDEPYHISTTRFTHQEINLAWEANDDVSEWEIEYGLSGFTRGNGTIKYTNNQNILITDLSPNTEYDFYIFSKCDNGNINNYTPAYKEKTRKDFSNGDLLTSNDEIRILYPDNVGERVRVEFTDYNIEQYNEIEFYFSNERNKYNNYTTVSDYNRKYTFNYNSNIYPIVSELEDGNLSYSQNIEGASYWEAKVYSEPKPSCETVNENEFLFQRVSSKEVEFVFGAEENTAYSVEYGPVGFSLGTGFVKEVDKSGQFFEKDLRRPYFTYKTKKNQFDEDTIYYSIVLDGLEEDTEYEFYITSICPDGFTNTYPVPKLVKTTPNLLKLGVYHANSSGQMAQRKFYTLLGQLENTTIYPNSLEERIVATIQRLHIPESYYNGEPFTVFDNNNSKDDSKKRFSSFFDIQYYHDDIIIKADNENGCLTFNFSFNNSNSFGDYIRESIEDWRYPTSKGWIVEITSEPKEGLSVNNITYSKNIILQPNPSKDYFFVKNNTSSKIKEITINDLTGRNVKEYLNTDFDKALYFNLTPGIYFVIIKTEQNNRITTKLIVK